ncbi:MAG: hypothetical protein A2Z99_09755 [Treponema sp. GWB1_62_6]|nr:MAG: hypothetical protein A2Z99_09755 [Treponema sp. GWB1_62_6]OHE66011.1 MAG: hypothetical protein A2001_15590 [Treponema sp. GWC1_61_84]
MIGNSDFWRKKMKRSLIISAFLISAAVMFAQDISLPAPGTKAGMDLFTAIRDRRVSKTFVKKAVSPADLSTLLWAGLGPRGVDAVTSATKSGRTASFSGDNPYINLYVLTDKGTWKYLPESNALKFLGGTDSLSAVSRAAIPDAALLILFTVDNTLTPSFLKANPVLFQQMAHATAGFAAQNIGLAAAALKMAAVVQYTLAPAGAAAAASLGKDEAPLFILQAGYTE